MTTLGILAISPGSPVNREVGLTDSWREAHVVTDLKRTHWSEAFASHIGQKPACGKRRETSHNRTSGNFASWRTEASTYAILCPPSHSWLLAIRESGSEDSGEGIAILPPHGTRFTQNNGLELGSNSGARPQVSPEVLDHHDVHVALNFTEQHQPAVSRETDMRTPHLKRLVEVHYLPRLLGLEIVIP